MPDIVLHPSTNRAVSNFLNQPAHALLLTGAPGSGKAMLAEHLISQILGQNDSATSIYEHPYVRRLQSIDNKSIAVEQVREVQKFLSLKIPGALEGQIARAIVIEDGHLLSLEAQNALLKTLEEPPADTIIILTVPSSESVLSTIRSRSQQLAVLSPGTDKLTKYFSEQGHKAADINRALMLSGELPGLASALLNSDEEHLLVLATTHARGILGSKTYERLLLVDSLSKQKQLCENILFVLVQMSRMALLRSTTTQAASRWQRIMTAAYRASDQLAHNTQAKLVLTNLMLELS